MDVHGVRKRPRNNCRSLSRTSGERSCDHNLHRHEPISRHVDRTLNDGYTAPTQWNPLRLVRQMTSYSGNRYVWVRICRRQNRNRSGNRYSHYITTTWCTGSETHVHVRRQPIHHHQFNATACQPQQTPQCAIIPPHPRSSRSKDSQLHSH